MSKILHKDSENTESYLPLQAETQQPTFDTYYWLLCFMNNLPFLQEVA